MKILHHRFPSSNQIMDSLTLFSTKLPVRKSSEKVFLFEKGITRGKLIQNRTKHKLSYKLSMFQHFIFYDVFYILYTFYTFWCEYFGVNIPKT